MAAKAVAAETAGPRGDGADGGDGVDPASSTALAVPAMVVPEVLQDEEVKEAPAALVVPGATTRINRVHLRDLEMNPRETVVIRRR